VQSGKGMGKAALSLVTLVVSCLLSVQTLPSFSSYFSSRSITTSGFIGETTVELPRPRKHVIAYVGTFIDERANFIASHFEMVITGFETASTIGKIKSANPNVTVLGYMDIMAMGPSRDDWAEVDQHEDWFLHDMHGNRLIHSYWAWYAMDVGNPDWRSHYANYVKDKLDTYPYDGVFADDVWEWVDYHNTVWTVDSSLVPPEIQQRWHNDMLEMIRFVKETIGNKLLIVNTSNDYDYVNACDGKMEESFAHPHWWSLDEFHDEWYDWKGKVDNLKKISQKGKYYLAHSGTKIPNNPTEAELDRVRDMVIYCLASYLLGVSGEKASFGFNNIYSKDGSQGYYREFDVSLGSHLNEYYNIGLVYARDFEGGKVLVNPTTSFYTVDLGAEYKTLDGEIISNVMLDGHSGIILLRP